MIIPIRLKNIACYIPPKKRSTVELSKSFGYTENFLEEKLGTQSLAIKEPWQQSSDLCVEAAKALQSQGICIEDIGVLVVCTQTPDDHGIPHTSAIVHKKLELHDDCACFDISLGCSGYVYGLSIVTAFMQANGIQRGLFFTSDPYSAIINPTDQATALLFGDSASVTLLEAEGPGWIIKDILFGTQGKGGDAIHNKSGLLEMNGREVFNFALTQVPRQIRKLIEKNNLTLEDLDLIVLHQGSRYIVDKIRERLGLSIEKVPVHLSGIGNTVSSAIPLTLAHSLKSVHSRILISGFGVGLSYASAILERHE